ncbi:unnamed protein product [Lymnaea stagnalis]|uniref:Uncharacterized protein n=1 Tax=Lymnaea stagnalis TaxID=6523 RepID=A0AAV2HKC8_LYMST
MFVSNHDQAHREHISVDFERKDIGFIQISQKDAKRYVQDILHQLEKDEMKLEDCRSQGYDNTALMAGHRSGVQLSNKE